MKQITNLFKNLSHMVFDVELVTWRNLQKHSTFTTDLCEAHVLIKIQRWCDLQTINSNDTKPWCQTSKAILFIC